jgi:hypothetical protein
MGPGGVLDNSQGQLMLGRDESFNFEESINLNSSSIIDWEGNNNDKVNATMSVDESISQQFI